MKALGTHDARYGFWRWLAKTFVRNDSGLVRKMTYQLICNVIPTLLILIGVGWFSLLALELLIQAPAPETHRVAAGQKMPEDHLGRGPEMFQPR